MEKVALIIGGSSGIGCELIRILLKEKYIVYNASRKPCKLVGVNNITYDAFNTSIDDVIKVIKEERIDLLIYSAGFSMAAPLEVLQEDDFRYLFEVNYFGVLKLLKKVIPIMKKQLSGKILLFSSIGSYLNIPYDTLYSASKASLNLLANELNIELNRFKIKAKSICIGPTDTNFSYKRKIYKASSPEYGKVLLDYNDFIDAAMALVEMEQTGMGAGLAAKKIYHIIDKMNYKVIENIGVKNKLLFLLDKLMPLVLINKLIKKKYYIVKK